MISYDNYKNRIEKLAKAKRVLHKFRFLICGVLALIVGTSVGLMCAKGAYTSGMSLSAQTVMFNEYYEVTAAKAFLSSPSEQHIEYRDIENNGDWTEQKPVKASKYAARTVTKKLVGYSYSSEVNFEILPLDAVFSVAGGSVTYGEIPNYTMPQLVSGHRVDESSLEFSYAQYGAPSTEVNAVESSLKIVDESGEDFTCCYNVTFSGKTLAVNKRNITITPEAYEFTYDGEAHTPDDSVTEDTLARLVNGDELTVTTGVKDNLGGAVNAGGYTVQIESYKFMHGGDDVTGWYRVTGGASRLTVKPRKIIIYTGNKEKIYDGKPAENVNLVASNLVEGHVIAADSSTLPNNPNVGTYTNKFGVIVVAGDGLTDVTRNYEIDQENSRYGTLTITPAKLTVTTATPEARVYDGTPLTDYSFEIEEILGVDFKIAAVRDSLSEDTTDAGEHLNDFKVEVTLNGVPVTDNFNITYNYGKIVVYKRALTIKTGSDSKVYDGKPLESSSYEESGKVPMHTLGVKKLFSVTNVTGAEGVKNEVKYTVYNEYGKDVGYNYEIEHISGTLIIEALKISVETVSDSREYDGTPFANADYKITRLNGDETYIKGLCGSDELTPTFITSRTQAGSQENKCAYTLPTYDGVRSNYEIVGDITYGTLTVAPKKVTVTINDVRAIVYGEEIPDNGFALDCGELPNGETLTFTTHYEMSGVTCTPETWQGYTLLNAGLYLIADSGDMAISGGNANLSNYELNIVKGTLEIIKRVIYYVTADDDKIYDGTALQNTDYETHLVSDNTKAGLLNGDELSILQNPTSIIDVQVRTNANYYSLPNANYSIDQALSTANFGTLEITPRPIIVYTERDEKPYDGSPLYNEGYTVKYAVEKDGEWTADETKDGLVARKGVMDTLTLTGTRVEITDAGSTPNANRYENANYEIKKYVDGTLTVEKLDVEIWLSVHWNYYGITPVTERPYEDFILNGSYVTGNEVLVNGELLQITAKFMQNDEYVTLKNVGSYVTVADTFKIFDAYGEQIDSGSLKDGATNYNISCGVGTEIVRPLAVTVNINDGTAVYGEDVSEKEYGAPACDPVLPYGEELSFTYKYDREVKNVGEYEILPDKAFIDDKEIDIDNCNYDFTIESGTLTVVSREITVQLKAEKSIRYGEALPENGFEVTSGTVIDKDEITFDYAYYLGTSENRVTPKNRGNYGICATAAYLNGGQIDIASNEENYNITVLDGTLEIDYAEIGVQIEDVNVTYGDELEYPAKSAQIVYGQLYYEETVEVAVKYVVDGEEQSEQPKDAGSYEIVLDADSTKFYNADGTECEVLNYVFVLSYEGVDFNCGTLTIGKKSVHIALTERQATYGREDILKGHATLGAGFERVDGSTDPLLAYGEVLIVSVNYKKGDQILGLALTAEGAVFRLGKGSYISYAISYRIKASADDEDYIDKGETVDGENYLILKNYEITCEESTLEVTPYAVTVRPNDNTCLYGTPESEIVNTFKYTDALTMENGGLPYGEELVLSYSYDPSPVTNAGAYKINGAATGVVYARHPDVTLPNRLNNYTVSYEAGTLTVEARTVYVVFGDNNTTKYGTAPANISYKIYLNAQGEGDEYALPSGYDIAADISYYKFGDTDKAEVTVKNVGAYGITADNARVENSAGETSANFEVEVIDGKLTVIPKPVKVVLNDIAPVYYGNTFVYAAGVDNYKNVAEIGLEYNERLEIAVEYLINGELGAPKNVNYNEYSGAYYFDYSARLNKNACVVYESDGETVIENGAANYEFDCEDLENLRIMRSMLFIYLKDLGEVEYGDFGVKVNYPDSVENYKKVEYLDGEEHKEGAPYNEKFKVRVEYLAEGDREPIENPVNVGTYKIRLSTVKVYESDGETVIENGTSNYHYAIAAPYQGTLEIIPRKITIKLSDYTIDYGDFYIEGEGGTFEYPDGANNYDTVNSDPLVFGQQLEVGFIDSAIYQKVEGGAYVTPKDVGKYFITFNEGDYAIFDGEETYYDGSYDITWLPGTLTITQKRVNVAISPIHETDYGFTELPEVIYFLSDKTGEEMTTLPYGDEFDADFIYYLSTDPYKTAVTVRNAGTYGITSETAYVNGEATAYQSIVGNYYFVLSDGALTVNRANLTLKLLEMRNSVYGDYHGEYPDRFDNYDVKNTVGVKLNDKINVAVKYEVIEDIYGTGLVTVGDVLYKIPKNAAKYKVMLYEENSIIRTEDGDINLAQNYNITCAPYEFTIERREVTVSFIVPNYVYGDTVQKPDFTIEIELYEFIMDRDKLPNDETCDFDLVYEDENGNETATPVNAGTYTIRLDKKYVNGEEKLAGNYNFTVNPDNANTLTINKKTVEITLDDMTAQYGDFEFTVPETHTHKITAGGLEYSDTLVAHVKFTAVGDEKTTAYITPKNVGYYSVVATEFTVEYSEDGSGETAAGDDLLNYEITCTHGTLEITPKKLHIALSKDVSIIYGETLPDYDDIPYTVNGIAGTDARMPYGEGLNVAMYYEGGKPENAGYYTIVYDGAAINLNPNDPNYEITGDDGLLTIEQRPITVTVYGGTATYGYTELPEIKHEVTVGELVGNEKLVPAYTFFLKGTQCNPVNAGTYDIVVDEENTTVTGGNALYANYAVNYVYEGKLVINASPLTVQIIGDSFVYGERDINVTHKITAGELYHGDELELTYTYINKESGKEYENPTAAGEYAIEPTAAIVGGNASVDNYDISYVKDDPTLTIEQRGIKITLNKGGVTAFTYGTPYAGDICYAEITDNVEGQTITVAVTYRLKQSGGSAARMLRARAFSARANEQFIPKDAGFYIASLDFENCTVTDANGAVDGGISNYKLDAVCSDVEFEITPMTLTVDIVNGSITYGERLPSALAYSVAENMPNGESLDLTFSFADEDGNLPVHVGTYPVTIADKAINGGKMGNYRLNIANENPTLRINEKEVSIRLNNLEAPYGTAVEYAVRADNYNTAASDRLADGDVLTVTEVKYAGGGVEYSAANPPENAGEYDVIYVSCTIVNADGEDATGDYIVTGLNGVLTINSSVVIVYTASIEETYDGEAHFSEEYDRVDGFDAFASRGYKIVVDKNNIFKQIDATADGGVNNTTEFKIVDENGVETSNLEIRYGMDNNTFGKIKVLPKNVEVTIEKATAVYGVQPAISSKTNVPLVGDEVLSFGVKYYKGLNEVTPEVSGGYFMLPVGDYTMDYAEDTAAISGGRGKASNYAFEFVPAAQLKITPRHIAVTTADDRQEYSGESFFKYDGYSTEWVVDGERKGVTGLLGDTVLDVLTYAQPVEVGEHENVCTYSVSDNYFIEEDMYGYGTLTITERYIKVKTADVVETYDGKPHSSGALTYDEERLVSGHRFVVTSEIIAVTDVTKGDKNVLTVAIMDGETDVSKFYDIDYDYGTITINQRPLEITTGSVSGETYDGQAHGNTDYALADGLVTDLEVAHTLVLDKEFTYVNATEGVDNKTTYKVFCGETNVTVNYKISYIYGKIVIDKAPVTVTLNGGVEVQYGNAYKNALTDGAVTLVNGETAELEITLDREISGVGVYTASADWTNTVVKDASGRVIANGADNYAPEFVPESVQFRVIPREIRVTLNAGGVTKFKYGDDYETAICTASVSGTLRGETLKVAVTYEETETPKYVGTYTARIDRDGCKVEGGDIANYNIVACDDVTFEIIARDLTVYMDNLTVGYGEPLVYPDGVSGYVRVDGLVEGDTLEVIPAFERDGKRVTPDFAGTYDVVCGDVVISGGAVGKENYNLITGKPYGTLEIEGIGIVIVRKTVTKTYDGEPLVLDENAPDTEVGYVINGDESIKLSADYRLVLDGTFATKDGNVSSSCANTAIYKVVDKNGDVAGNFVVSYENNGARLEITQKTLNVTTRSETRQYNGTALTAGYDFNEDELISGHTISAVTYAQITDVGSTPNSMTFRITAANGVVTANYDIQVTAGTLTVEVLPFEVEISDQTKVYGENLEAAKKYQSALINGEKLSYSVLYTKGGEPCDTTNHLDKGEYGIIGDINSMSVSGGKLTNYDISFKQAKLTVTERHIIVITANDRKEYDGTALTKSDGYTTEWVVDGVKKGVSGLLNGDTLTVESYASQTEIGEIANECTYSVSENYVIDGYEYGKLTVTKIAIKVTTNDIVGEYRGTAYSDGGFTAEGKLLTGHSVALSGDIPEFLDATDGAQNKFAVAITAGGTDVTDEYYEISYNYGNVVISKRALTVTLNKGGKTTFEYGDDTFDAQFKNFTADGLVGGDELTTLALSYGSVNGVPVFVGSYSAQFDLAGSFITYAGDGNGLKNYTVTCAAVYFEIVKIQLTITLGEWAAEEYDGKTHAFDSTNYEISGGALAYSDEVTKFAVRYCKDTAGLVPAGIPKDAGTYYVFIDLTNTLVLGSGKQWAISDNYDLTCNYVEFEITPAQLVITLSDVTHTYDGKAYDFASGDGFATNLFAGDEIACNVTYDKDPVNVGAYTVTFDENIEFTKGNAGNYEFDRAASTLTCTLEITERDLTVKVNDRDVERGSEEYTKSDITANFADGDLDKAEVTFTYFDEDGNELAGLPDTTGKFTVKVTLGGEVMKNYVITENTDGTLTVTERKVLVTPVFNGTTPYVYDGEAVDISLFGYTHTHNVANAAEDDKYGFTDEDAANFTATYTFKDLDGKVVSGTPVNAGIYVVSVTLSGDGIEGYEITYKTLTFVIQKRPLSYTVEVDGAGKYVYTNSRPDFSADLTAYDGFVNGVLPEYTFELFDNGKIVTRYNVGKYTVQIAFEGMENYKITATTAEIEITRRTIVVTPTDPYGGVAQDYNGTDLTLGSGDFTIASRGLEYGDLADGDSVAITGTKFAPTSVNGWLYIESVSITDGGEDVSQNYTVIYEYNATNEVIKSLGLLMKDFRIRASYTQTEIHYTLGNVAKSFPYTGATTVYEFGGDSAVTLSAGQTLNFEHTLGTSKDSVTVPAAAGEYTDLITKLVRVYYKNGANVMNVTAIYNLVCDNPENGVIKVVENVVSVDLSGITAGTLTSGLLDCAVTFGDESTACSFEVHAFNLDGEWLIGVTLFKESDSGRRTDVSANYKLDESCTLDGATVKIITLEEAEIYARPAIGVKITVTESALKNGKGSLYSFDGESRWVLTGGYTVDGEENLLEGHVLQVLVLRENGRYLLGVTIYKVENGIRKDASKNYRLKDLVTTDVEARYIAVSEVTNSQRELFIDFSGAFDGDGAPKTENGLLTGYTVEGLSVTDKHQIEVTVTDNGDGTYTLNVAIYQLRLSGGSYRKFNMAGKYDLVYTAPAGYTAVPVTGSLN